MCRFSAKTDYFDFSDPNLRKNGSSGRNFNNLSPNSKSASARYHECQFSFKTDNFEFFRVNLGKLPNYMQYFDFNNIEGVADSWVEVEKSWGEVEMG